MAMGETYTGVDRSNENLPQIGTAPGTAPGRTAQCHILIRPYVLI